jgi:hypothetical protein
MNKKGEGYGSGRKYLFWLAFVGIAAALFIAFGAFTAVHKNKITYVPPELHSETIALRFTNNPDCFAFKDDFTGRISPGIIDINKFNKETLNGCYQTAPKAGIKDFNFLLKLEGRGVEIFTNNYFHHNNDDLTLFKQVLINDNDELSKDTLIIYVQEKIGT